MGLGSGEQYESRFLRKCIDGGHAGIGHRRRAVGNQDFLRRVNRQEAGVEQETSGQEEVRYKGITSAAAEAFCPHCRQQTSLSCVVKSAFDVILPIQRTPWPYIAS